MNIFYIQILVKNVKSTLITKPKKEIKMKKAFIYGLSVLAVAAVMVMQVPVQAATTTTTTTYPNKVVPAHKTTVKPVKKVVTTKETKDKGVTIKNITETKTTKTNTTQKMPATK